MYTMAVTNVEISPHAHTAPTPERSLEYRRAVLTFIGSYALIEVVAAMCSILVAAITHTNFSGSHADVHNHAFVTSERFYPLINLASWMTFAAIYFRRPAGKWSLTRMRRFASAPSGWRLLFPLTSSSSSS